MIWQHFSLCNNWLGLGVTIFVVEKIKQHFLLELIVSYVIRMVMQNFLIYVIQKTVLKMS